MYGWRPFVLHLLRVTNKRHRTLAQRRPRPARQALLRTVEWGEMAEVEQEVERPIVFPNQ